MNEVKSERLQSCTIEKVRNIGVISMMREREDGLRDVKANPCSSSESLCKMKSERD